MSISAPDGVGYVPLLALGLVSLREPRQVSARELPGTIGEHVRERRLALGLTQADAAARIGLTRDGLTKWETGLREPGYARMPAVISFLGYNPEPVGQSFAELVKGARRRLGLSQGQVSRLLDVPVDTLRLWEQGKCQPSRARRARIVRCIEVALKPVS
jgi:DNA-binding transcriptional regulator YiaG